MTMEELCNQNGFLVEMHQVVTDDGYILDLYRIPGRFDADRSGVNKPVVLLQHGLEADMLQWVVAKPEDAPAFVLSDAGYDIWLGNNRGTHHSLGHTHLNHKKDREYWHFTWEQMGTYDTPAVIKYIKKFTGHAKITMMGHSEGTTQIMAGASLMPDFYRESLNLAVFLAPPASCYNFPNELTRAIAEPEIMNPALKLAEDVNFLNWFPHNFETTHANEMFCNFLDGRICEFIIAALMDGKSSTDDWERRDIWISQMPAGAGAFNFQHYGQLIHTEKEAFRRFNYGSKEENMRHYNQTSPPDYELRNLNFPIGIFSGELDKLADPKDVAWLVTQIEETLVFNKQYYLGHLGFAVGKDMSWLHQDAVPLIKKYNPTV